MFLTFVKFLFLFSITNSVLGHGRKFKDVKNLRILIKDDGIVMPLDNLSRIKRHVIMTPSLNSDILQFDTLSLLDSSNNQKREANIHKNYNKRWFNATPIDFNELTKKTFFKISNDIDKSDDQIQLEIPTNSSEDSKWNHRFLNNFIDKLDPILGKLEADGGEEMQKFLEKNHKGNNNKTISLANLAKLTESEVAENDGTNSIEKNHKVFDEMKKINNIIKLTNTNTTSDMLKKQFPPLKSILSVIPKQEDKNYASLWEVPTAETTTKVSSLKKMNKTYLNDDNAKQTYDVLMKLLNNLNGSGTSNNKETNEIVEKLLGVFKDIQSNGKKSSDVIVNSAKGRNAISSKEVRKDINKAGKPLTMCTPFIIKQSSTVKDVVIDLMNINASDIYTKVNNVFSAPIIESTTICNMLSRKYLTYVRPECTRYKGQITCKMGRFTYVINNGDQDISNDVLSKFVALIYRRSLEGDKCFDISIVNPSSTPSICQTTRVVSTTTEALKPDYTPVTVECTPVRKDEIPLGVECGANTPVPQEIIYECKWKKLGI